MGNSLTEQLLNRGDLTAQQAGDAVRYLLDPSTSDVGRAALLAAWRSKGYTGVELAGGVEAVLERSVRVELATPNLVDTCGTGGGPAGLNLSTGAALVAAAAGAKVAKHGGRSVSSASGSADVLEALGAHITLSPEQVARCIAEVGVGFMFAPAHHGAMKHAAPVRKELGVRTLFNILGPLTNPAGARNQVLGVFHPDLVGIQARVLQRLGSRHVMVVHGLDGLDELSLAGETLVAELKDGELREYTLTPETFGLRRAPLAALRAEDAGASRALLVAALSGEPGPAADVVALNAGAAIYAAGLAPSHEAGVAAARQTMSSGAAMAKLEAFVRFTRSLAQGPT